MTQVSKWSRQNQLLPASTLRTGEVRDLDYLIAGLACAHWSCLESVMCQDNLDTLNVGYDFSHVSKNDHSGKFALSSEIIVSVLIPMS